VVAGPDGFLFDGGGSVRAGRGVGLLLELPGGLDDASGIAGVGRRLRAVDCRDHAPGAVGHAVVACGALPFDRDAPGALVVPELLVGRDPSGAAWITVVGDPSSLPASAGAALDLLRERTGGVPPAASDPPEVISVRWAAGPEAFTTTVAGAVSAIARGEVSKVVLSRRMTLVCREPVDVTDLLRRWRSVEPGGTLFSTPTPGGTFVGASPELLVARSGRTVTSRPLAGTTRRPSPSAPAPPAGGPPDRLPGHLLSSTKDAGEHRFVVDAIRSTLEPLVDDLSVPAAPELVHLHNLSHLGTSIEGTLHDAVGGGVPTALELVAALHPTPAVAGTPTSVACDMIRRLEGYRRGPYAGPVGFVDAGGDGRWVVGIRAVTVAGTDVTLTAGVGIVAASDPETELQETDLKFAAVLDAVVPGLTLGSVRRTDGGPDTADRDPAGAPHPPDRPASSPRSPSNRRPVGTSRSPGP
jgi:menaquinone-specific isochorismate synthase